MTWFIAFLFWVYCKCAVNQLDMLLLFFFHLYAISWLSELDIGNFLFWLFKKEGCFVAYCVLKRENAVFIIPLVTWSCWGYGAYMVSLCIRCGESTHFV